jgi:hypothetical protein
MTSTYHRSKSVSWFAIDSANRCGFVIDRTSCNGMESTRSEPVRPTFDSWSVPVPGRRLPGSSRGMPLQRGGRSGASAALHPLVPVVAPRSRGLPKKGHSCKGKGKLRCEGTMMLQYARAMTTRRSLSPPQTMHCPISGGRSRGMQRIVAFVSAFTLASQSASPHQ